MSERTRFCVNHREQRLGKYVRHENNTLRQEFYCNECIEKYNLHDRVIEPTRFVPQVVTPNRKCRFN